MNRFFISLICFTFSLGVYSQNDTLNTVLEKYYAENGKQEFMKINSIIKEGHRVRNDFMPVTYYQVRPNKYMMKFDLADITAYRVYDGKNAWFTAPWRGTVNPELFTEEQLEAALNSFAFDPNLYSWKSNGNSLVYVGMEIIDDQEHFVLEFTNNKSNQNSLYFINCKTYLLTKISAKTTRNEEEVITETFFSEYKKIDGIMFYFLEETYSNGVRVLSVEYDEITLNPEIEEDFFKRETHFENILSD